MHTGWGVEFKIAREVNVNDGPLSSGTGGILQCWEAGGTFRRMKFISSELKVGLIIIWDHKGVQSEF